MARGWESKSVEGQIEAAQAGKQSPVSNGPDPAYLVLVRQKETLLLSRTRIMRDLETSQNDRYRKMLASALADLNTRLAVLSQAFARGTAAS